MYYYPCQYHTDPYYPVYSYAPRGGTPSSYDHYPYAWPENSIRQFPPVDPELLTKSAGKFHALMQQADLLVNKISQSKDFAYQLMEAAQASNKQKVEELIKSTGITIKVKPSFTPTGIRIELDNSEFAGDCCKLLIGLRW